MKMQMACGCCGGNDAKGYFHRDLWAEASVDTEGVSTANWAIETIDGKDYFYYFLSVADAATDTASVIMQPIRYTIIERNDPANVLDKYRIGGSRLETVNSAVLPSGSHFNEANIASLTSYGMWKTENATILSPLPGESYGDPTNLGVRDGVPYAPRRGGRPRYMKIYGDGEDVLGLVDLDELYTTRPDSYPWIWAVTSTIPFKDYPISSVNKLPVSFPFKYGVEYSLEIYYELKIEPKAGSAVFGPRKCGHVVKRGDAIHNYTTEANAVPLSHFHDIRIEGLPAYPEFDFDKHTYEITPEFTTGDISDWVVPPPPWKLTAIGDGSHGVGRYLYMSTTVQDPNGRSQDFYASLNWSHEIPRVTVHAWYYPRTERGKKYMEFQPDTADYANSTVLPNGNVVSRGVLGIWENRKQSTFYSSRPQQLYNPDIPDVPIGELPESAPSGVHLRRLNSG